MSDLKSCPFCGGNDIEMVKEDSRYYRNVCQNQLCDTHGPIIQDHGFYPDEIIRYANDAWNERFEISPDVPSKKP